MSTKTLTPEQQAKQQARDAAARRDALRTLAAHLLETAIPTARRRKVATGGHMPAYRTEAERLDYLRSVYEACTVLENFPAEPTPAQARDARKLVVQAACDTDVLPPQLRADLARPLGAARLERDYDKWTDYFVPSETHPGDWRRVTVRKYDDGQGSIHCSCPSTKECFHIRNVRALVADLGAGLISDTPLIQLQNNTQAAHDAADDLTGDLDLDLSEGDMTPENQFNAMFDAIDACQGAHVEAPREEKRFAPGHVMNLGNMPATVVARPAHDYSYLLES